MAMAKAVGLPAPPADCGNDIAKRPRPAASWRTSSGTRSKRSKSAAFSSVMRRANSRTVCAMRSSSSVNWKAMEHVTMAGTPV
jgi:hypothetical protein